MKLANLTLLISNLYWNFKTFCEVVLHIWRLCYNMLCKKQSAIIIINNKQIHLLLKIWLRLHFGTHPSLKINSGTNPIFENRWYSGRCPLRHSGSCNLWPVVRGGQSHLFRLWSCSKNFGICDRIRYGNFLTLRIRLLFRLRLKSSIQP